MASDAVFEFTDDNFATEAMASSQPVLVDFWAEWCGPCRALAPLIDSLADEYAGRAKIGKLDVDSNRNVAAQFSVMSIPTIVIIKNGELSKQFVGLSSEADLKAALDDAM